MSELRMSELAWKLVTKRKIMPNDVVELRQEGTFQGLLKPDHVATLLALETTCCDKCDDWSDYFVTAISDHILAQTEPVGRLSQDKIAWLKRATTRNGRVATANELEVLVQILERSTNAPQALCELILDQLPDMLNQLSAAMRDHKYMLGQDIINATQTMQRLNDALGERRLFELLQNRNHGPEQQMLNTKIAA